MRNLRYIVRLVSAFLSRFRGILLVGIILGILLFLFLSLFGNKLIPARIERVGLTGRHRVESLPPFILKKISLGLTEIDAAGGVTPSLAKFWYTPDKGLTWIFELEEGKVWHDGKGVDSASVNYTFSDAGLEKPDAKTLVFKLQNPFSPFPLVVSRPIFREGLVGTGEWKVIKLSVAGTYIQQITLENREGEKTIYKFYPTEERTKLAYKLGQVDGITNIFNPEPFLSWNTAEVIPEIDKKKYVAVFFNIQDKFLGEKDLRQALSYAINKEAFSEERALGPVSPDSWAYNPQVKPYNYDPKRAKELISELPKEIRDEIHIKLTTTAVLLATAEKIVKDWDALGIKASVQVVSALPENYQAFLAIFDTPADPDQYAVWHSTQTATNISKYKNPRIDKLLEDGRLELDIEARRKIYLDFQRFLVEDSPAVFLYHPVSYTVRKR